MIGRAALHNPVIFRDIAAHRGRAPLVGNEVGTPASTPCPAHLGKIEGAPNSTSGSRHQAREGDRLVPRGIAHGKDIRTRLQDITAV